MERAATAIAQLTDGVAAYSRPVVSVSPVDERLKDLTWEVRLNSVELMFYIN